MSRRAFSDMAVNPPRFRVRALTGAGGCVVEGVRLHGGLSTDMVDALNSALLSCKVLFFRDQQHLDSDEQERVAALFGVPFTHPNALGNSGAAMLILSSDTFSETDNKHPRNDVWHVDGAYLDAYPKIAVLQAVVVPPFGDTLWANTATAYRRLAEPLRRLADRLWVRHSNAPCLAPPDARTAAAAARFEALHPMVIVHPETRERSLLLGNLAQRIDGLSARESAVLIDLFQSHIERPEHVIRWSWREGDVAIWDARSSQNFTVDDYGEQERLMRRVLVKGEAPIGVDGRRSVAVY
ncbi:TauD/TfdA family dioxygenase [Pendulispora brunnea]|uniref:TauD/TfdA family dioxygenase n=1 Tax=Pendulispora brunnea TaxID=2905690 RepID=A0ABZ2KNR0_9BACT